MLFRETYWLIKKEFLLEWRTKTGLQSIFLYAVSTVFLCYWAIHKIEGEAWVALYWLMVVFSALNSVGRGFLQEPPGLQLYYYGLASPYSILFSKMAFNALILILVNSVLLFFYSLTLGFPIIQVFPFLLCVFLGILALSGAITFLSSIASKASGNLSLLAILGLPVLLPILFLVIHFSVGTLNHESQSFGKDILALVMINFLVPSVAALVFPYIWRN
jgi:heme exporter protein B